MYAQNFSRLQEHMAGKALKHERRVIEYVPF